MIFLTLPGRRLSVVSLLAVLLVCAANCHAQVFKKLYTFTGSPLTGAGPISGLLAAPDGYLYGTSAGGGAFGYGTLYRTDATGNITVLHSFRDRTDFRPVGQLTLGPDGAIYGVCAAGGPQGQAVIYRYAGGQFSLFRYLAKYVTPAAGLTVGRDGKLYGTAGGLYRVDTAGHFRVLGAGGTATGELVEDAHHFFYGVTDGYGAGQGTVFRVDRAGNWNVLHTFSGTDGASPAGGLVLAHGDTLYGVAGFGGDASGDGTVWSFSLATSQFQVVHTFTGADGSHPKAGLVLLHGRLYGTAYGGGPIPNGCVFRINPDGTSTVLHSFTGADGATPVAPLVLGPDGAFYGATQFGGTNYNGVLFRCGLHGGLTELYEFPNATQDAEYPSAPLLQASDGMLYGVSWYGGQYDSGVLFRIGTKGTAYTRVHDFNGSDGFLPWSQLVEPVPGTLCGTTVAGGANQFGTFFSVDSAGTVKDLHDFGGPEGGGPVDSLIVGPGGQMYCSTAYGQLGTDGAGTLFTISRVGQPTILKSYSYDDSTTGTVPLGPIAFDSAGNLYGTTQAGGAHTYGTLFEIATTGGYHILHDFAIDDGIGPTGVLMAADGNLYGTAPNYGPSNFYNAGTLFRFDTLNADFSVLDSFAWPAPVKPVAPPIQGRDGYLYGVCQLGDGYDRGPYFYHDNGALYRTDSAGNLKVLHYFTGYDGMAPQSALIQGKDGKLYGVANMGGGIPVQSGAGVVFSYTLHGIHAADVSAQVTGAASALSFDSDALVYRGTLTVSSSAGVPGPLQIVLYGLPFGAILANANGAYYERPFLTIPGGIPAGGSVTLPVAFDGLKGGTVTYTVKALEADF